MAAEFTLDEDTPWVEMLIGDGWKARFRLVVESGEVVVGELRVVSEGERVPRGGLPARKLRDIRFEAARAFSREALAALYHQYGDEYPLFRPMQAESPRWLAWLESEARHRAGPKGRDDLFYAVLAANYSSKVQSGRQDAVSVMADELHLSPSHLRALLATARERELLTGTKQGRAGGALTEKARELLRSTVEVPGVPSEEAFGIPTITQSPKEEGTSHG